MIAYLIAFLVSVAASLVLTPLVGKLSTRFGFVDRPDGKRKSHEKPVALGGGGAVLVAALIAVACAMFFASFIGLKLFSLWDLRIMAGLLIGSLLIVGLGLIDDFIGLQGRYKLLGQAFVVAVIIFSGIRIESIAIFEGRGPAANEEIAQAVVESTAPPIESASTESASTETAPSEPAATPSYVPSLPKVGIQLGLLALPFTFFWLIGSINAINLIDGIDGLASSVGLVLCLTIAAITSWQGNTGEAMVMLALAGALLGFLRFNFAPASIYLGDAGSMLIGLIIGTIAIHSSTKSAATMALAVPCGVWAIPILDSMAAILRRKLTGRSFFTPDRGHLHHSLLVRGWSVRQAVLFIGLICATTCLSAVLSIYFNDERIALATVAAVVIFLISTQTFGHIEFALLKQHFRLSPLGGWNGNDSRINESRIQLQGARQWDKLWTAMIESAEEYQLVRMKLTIHIPALSEDYYASWDALREHKKQAGKIWQIAHPLIVDGETVGRLELGGLPSEGSSMPHMVQVLDFLEPIEDDIRQIMEQIQLEQPIVQVGQSTGSQLRKARADAAQLSEPAAPASLASGEALANN